MDKWMIITNMDYVIASRYNVILVYLSLQQSEKDDGTQQTKGG